MSSSLFKTSVLTRPSLEASIIGESAIIDKETGRVLWEGGGSSTLSASLAPKLYQLGFSHLKATLLTAILFIGLLGYVSIWFQHKLKNSTAASSLVAKTNPKILPLLAVVQWAIVRTPKLDRWFLICIVIFYLVEAYTCSTRRYLSNAISGLEGVEEYIEHLRVEKPEVQWKVRCFHYESPWFLAPLRLIAWLSTSKQSSEDFPTQSNPSCLSRKVVTHQSTRVYDYKHCIDKTIAGVWRQAAFPSSEAPPFTKILLSKLLVLPDKKARDDYMQQQSRFVTSHGQGDQFAEFATSVRMAGFQTQLLAIRRGSAAAVHRTKLVQQALFWIFTLVGLTVPYRMWFSDHCDVIRVTIVKEVSPTLAANDSYKSWFMSSSSSSQTERDDSATFRSLMRKLRLYATQDKESLAGNASTDIDDIVEASRELSLLTKNSEDLDSIT